MKILIFFFASTLITCSSKYSKEKHLGTMELAKGLFWEVYETYSGGVFAGTSYSYYLTDSANFRAYVISTNHDDESVQRLFKNDTVIVVKVGNAYSPNPDTINTKHFVISELAASRQWD